MKTGLKYAVLGLAFISAGWFANEALRPEKAFAAKTLEYKLLTDSHGWNLESVLNTQAKEGWRFHSAINSAQVVFER